MFSRFAQISRLCITLLIPIIIIAGSMRVMSTDAYLAFEYGKAGFPPDSYGFTPTQRFDLASASVHYVRAHLSEDALSKQMLAGKPVYTAREAAHMLDVRAVFQSIFRLWQLAFILLLLLVVILWRKEEWSELALAFRSGGLLTTGFVLSIALLAFFAWQAWFNLLHRFFFESGSWLFDYTDTLIRLFPLKFWSDATFTISLLSLVGGLITALTAWFWSVSLETSSVKISS